MTWPHPDITNYLRKDKKQVILSNYYYYQGANVYNTYLWPVECFAKSYGKRINVLNAVVEET